MENLYNKHSINFLFCSNPLDKNKVYDDYIEEYITAKNIIHAGYLVMKI